MFIIVELIKEIYLTINMMLNVFFSAWMNSTP